MAEQDLHSLFLSSIDKVYSDDIVDIVQQMHASDPQSVRKPNDERYTPTHLAAMHANPGALRALLALGGAEDLDERGNKNFLSPLQCIQAKMWRDRWMGTDADQLRWAGYAEESIRCEYALLAQAGGAGNANLLGAPDEAAYLAKRKLGCTCGSCLGGWLSPRMRARLSRVAKKRKDSMDDFLHSDTFVKYEQLPEYRIHHSTKYLPSAIGRRMYKTFYRNWAETFETVHSILETAGSLPTVANLARICAFCSPVFLQKGGKVEYVLDELIVIVKKQHEFDEIYSSSDEEEEEEDEEMFDEEYYKLRDSREDRRKDAELPPCENDNGFALVRLQVGLDPALKWGPYERDMYNDEDEEEEEEDTLPRNIQADFLARWGHFLGAEGARQ